MNVFALTLSRMNQAPATYPNDTTKPLAARIALAVTLGVMLTAAFYLYAVRGNAIILDMANGLAGMFCF